MGNIHRLACSEDKREKIKATRLATKQRRQNQVGRVAECKIVENKLSKRQKDALQMLFVEAKWFYNHVLALRNETHLQLREINTTDIREVVHLDKDGNRVTTALRHLSSQQKQAIVQRMIANEFAIINLIARGYQKHGELQFKSEIDCIPLKQYGYTHKIQTRTKVRIAGIKGNVRVRGLDQVEDADEYANANLVRKADGYYFMLTAYKDKSKISKPKSNGKEIGLDFGIKTNITTSDGEKIYVAVRESERLKRLQRSFQKKLILEKKEKRSRSKRRAKVGSMMRKEYQKLTNRKWEIVNQLIHRLRKYKCVVFQDEQIANWHKGLFGRQVQHSCMGMLKARLKRLDNAVMLDRLIPTTKYCPECGRMNRPSLADRTYVCECGRSLDRDVHSAKNMLAIKNLVFSKQNLNNVPTEHREITLAEFRAAIGRTDESLSDGQAGTKKREAVTLKGCW